MSGVTVIGGGAWGTALATVAHRAAKGQHPVRLWARNPDVIVGIRVTGVNEAYLPSIRIDPMVEATTKLADALAGTGAVLLVVPAQAVRETAEALAAHLPAGIPVALCAKGIERGSMKMMTEVAAECLPEAPLAVLSGPTFAAEVARGQPTAVTLAGNDKAALATLRDILGTSTFRPYLSDDPIGAEVGGAVKNVIAIAAGIVRGKKLGENAGAALLTRGLAEMTRLAVAMGGRAETLSGLAGLGDLALTTGSLQSRNTSFGNALGEGKSIDEILGQRRAVTEGFWSAEAVLALAASKSVEMPITAAVAAILKGDQGIDEAVEGLLSRPYKEE